MATPLSRLTVSRSSPHNRRIARSSLFADDIRFFFGIDYLLGPEGSVYPTRSSSMSKEIQAASLG